MDLKRNEDEEQQTVVEWARVLEKRQPELGNLYHVPNEGKRSAAEAARQARMGLKPGVPDLILDVPKGRYHGLRVEMKVKPNRTTPAQDEWLHRLYKQGYFVAVCYSATEAIHAIQVYLTLRPGQNHPADVEWIKATERGRKQ